MRKFATTVSKYSGKDVKKSSVPYAFLPPATSMTAVVMMILTSITPLLLNAVKDLSHGPVSCAITLQVKLRAGMSSISSYV